MPEAKPVRPWRIERYREGDERAVLDLFQTVFGKSRSLAHWVWQFKDNPYGGPFVSLARREDDGAVVGSYSVMPVMLNVMGRAVLACQSVDTAVHPDHRGQRVFEKTASDCYAWCQSQGVQAVVGFPNANSYPGFVRTLEWRRIAFPVQYTLRLGVEGPLRRVVRLPLVPELGGAIHRSVRRIGLVSRRAWLRRLLGGGIDFRSSATAPVGYDDLWNAWRSQEVLSIWKDTDYLRWRYDRNPDHRFTYFSLSRGAELLALAIGVELDATLVLCEWMVRGRDAVVGQRLAAEIGLHALARGMDAVSFLGWDAGAFDDAFAGFRRQKSYANVFCGRAFDQGVLAELLPLPHNWTVTFGDGDFV